MRLLLQLPFVKVLTLLLLPHILFGQDQGQSGGGESAAESSVTTSSSKKSAAAPETIESNPVVTVVKSGLPIQTAISIPVDEMVQVAEAGGSLTNLKTTATTIVELKAQGKDPAAVIKSAVKAINKGIKFTSNAGQGFLDVAVSLVDGKINENELADVKSNLDSGVDLTVQEIAGVSYIKTEVAKGTSAATINSKLKGKSADGIKKAKEELTVIGDLIKQGLSEEDASTIANSGGDASMADFIKEVYKINDSDELKETLAQLFAYKDSDGKLFYSSESEQLAFKSAFSVFSQFLNNFNINSESDLPLEISYSSITDPDNPYIKELIKLFVVYGALGDSAEKIISDIGFNESGGMENLFAYSDKAASSLADGTATSDFLIS